MNYRGSYRHLLRNGKAALLAAIEIYNKPRIEYRDECFVILLLNAWELALKALLSRNRRSIFYPKRRKEPYRTLSCKDAMIAGEQFFPKDLAPLPVRRNLELLSTYRDNSVHFYNVPDFGSVIYALAQTSVVNLKDLLQRAFGVDLGKEITWQLLPIGLEAPIDPIQYISGQDDENQPRSAAVRQFLTEIASAAKEIQDVGADTGRLLTVFAVKLESIKKIQNADVVVGVGKAETTAGPLAVVKTLDPNITHPHRQKDIVEAIGDLQGMPFSSHVFQAIAWKHGLKANSQYCWQVKGGWLTRYSNETTVFLKRLTKADVEAALHDYREHLRSRARSARKQESR
ncbi:MAG: DUF3644 domain-containing protein [Terriglobia bacterium]